MELRESSALLLGRLILLKDGLHLDTFIATSGCTGNQSRNSQDDRGKGCLPSTYELGGASYAVQTTPYDMRGRLGIDGNFFKINPDVVTIWGRTRGDFGVHKDANAPGSAGCVVLPTGKGWTAFQEQMAFVAKEAKEIPLIVSYS